MIWQNVLKLEKKKSLESVICLSF